MIKLIVGLGNPGKKYEFTRHNIGFLVADKIAELLNISFKTGFKGEYGVGSKSNSFFLLKPQTYMNLSGESVGEFSRYYRIPPENILIIYDELAFKFGTIKLRKGGSSGGHNGIKSIISHLGGESFPRIRIGIGDTSDNSQKSIVDYVLGNFTSIEKSKLDDLIEISAEAALMSVDKDFDKVMAIYNKNN